MSAENNKMIVRRWYEDVLSAGNEQLIDTLFTSNYTHHEEIVPGGWPRGTDGAYALVHTYRAASSDIRYTTEGQFADGDKVITRWSAHGTHTGVFLGAPASGKPFTITGISIERIEGDRIAETWSNWDLAGLMAQLGLLPAMG